MADVAIRCQGLGKRYALGAVSYGDLRETLTAAARRSIRRLRGRGRSSGEAFWALRDVSFDVHRGEIVGIIGRNGAGKSTLLKLLSRITVPSAGWAEICGRIGSLLEIGTGFHSELTGRENVLLNGAILGMRRDEIARKFDQIVAFAEVERFIDTPVKHYSSGMQVRLAFSVAAHLEPEILLVDEVLAVGDVSFQQKCLGRMSDVRHEGRTILFVSHNMNAVRRLCSRCLVIDGGRLVHDGAVDAAIERYLGDSARAPERAEIDTAALPRESSSDGVDLRIVAVRVHSASSTARLAFSEPLVVSLVFDVRRPLRDVSWSFTVETPDATPVVDCISMQSLPPVSFEPGLWSVTGTLEPNPLRPGTYRLTVGVGSQGRQRLDWLAGVTRLMIDDDADISQTWEVDQPTLIRLRSAWKKPERVGGLR